MSSGRSAVFLDRDGTLNLDTGYVHRWEDWRWLPGVVETLRRLRAAGFALVVVSNQSGLARGLFDTSALHLLERRVEEDLAARSAHVDAWYYCPHLPELTGPCLCRKPLPGLLLRAARQWGLDLSRSWMVGDSERDMRAGQAAGCRCILLQPQGSVDRQPPLDGVEIVPHLPAAGVRILREQPRRFFPLATSRT